MIYLEQIKLFCIAIASNCKYCGNNYLSKIEQDDRTISTLVLVLNEEEQKNAFNRMMSGEISLQRTCGEELVWLVTKIA